MKCAEFPCPRGRPDPTSSRSNANTILRLLHKGDYLETHPAAPRSQVRPSAQHGARPGDHPRGTPQVVDDLLVALSNRGGLGDSLFDFNSSIRFRIDSSYGSLSVRRGNRCERELCSTCGSRFSRMYYMSHDDGGASLLYVLHTNRFLVA